MLVKTTTTNSMSKRTRRMGTNLDRNSTATYQQHFGFRITLITEFSSCKKVAISTNKCTLELIKGTFGAFEHALKSGNKKNGCCLCGS